MYKRQLLIFLASRVAQGMGFAFDTQTLTALIFVAALPRASNVSMLAECFGVDSDRISRIIMVSTALSFFTFSGLVWVMGIHPA